MGTPLQSNSLILKHRDKTYTLENLETTPIKKTAQELRIIEARKKGISIGQMDGDGLRYVCDQVIVRGAALYGCDMPQTEFFAAILSKEFSDYLLQFGYDNLTLEEIILAMRINADGNFINPMGEDITQIAFFGNFIHISFISKVLHGYLTLRNGLEAKFKNHIDGY